LWINLIDINCILTVIIFYAQANWEHLKKEKSLCVKTILELEVKFKKFAEKTDILIEVEAWNFTPATLATATVSFYNRICQLPHPAFYSGGDNLAIAANLLTESEWRVLGLIWKLYPLPVGKLVKYNADGSETIIPT
jgi:hypothetical protein